MHTNNEPPLPESFEHYNSEIYQKTVRLERGCNNGMEPKEVYAREAEFALRAANLKDPRYFRDGERIMDLACGAGNHAFCMDALLQHRVPIDAFDLSDQLMATTAEQKKTHDSITFALGDMLTINRDNVQEGKKYRLITVLGTSFMYGNVRQIKEALRHYYDLLEPGGKLVLQSREPDRFAAPEVKKNREDRIQKGRDKLHMERYLEWYEGQNTPVFRDAKTGEKFRHVEVDGANPDPLHPEEYIENLYKVSNEKTLRWWNHKETGIRYQTFKRVHTDPQGNVHELPPTRVDSFLWADEFEKTSKGILEKAGFVDVHLCQPESEEDYLGHGRLLAIVAKKPEHTVIQKQIEFWERHPN